MPTTQLIGLGGLLRAGKDAVAEHLAFQHGYTTLGMSDALNEALLLLNPLIEVPGGRENFSVMQRYRELHDSIGYVEAKKNPEVRRLLQVLGTEIGREMISEDVWVKIAEKRITGLLAEGKPVVITAMRFPNEIEMLNRLGGVALWVERDAVSRFEGLATGGVLPTPGKGISGVSEAPVKSESMITAHASENSVHSGLFHAILDNSGTLEDLYTKTDTFLEFLEEENLREGVRYPHWDHQNEMWPPYDR